MTPEPLVVSTREPAEALAAGDAYADAAIENVHFGSVAVVSLDGALLRRAGDPHVSTFTRSTLKPLQALPFVREGGPDRFGWGSREIAMMCASHSGEPMHTGRVGTMLASIDADATQLRCGCHVPGFYAALGRKPPVDLAMSPLEHNCSGKHAGFLAACRLNGQAPETYLDPQGAVQRRVADAVADLVELPAGSLASGTDGCSAPNLAMPLSRLALAYARLAQGSAGPREGASLAVLSGAMTAHPELVSGTARSDLALMRHAPGDWVCKIGADGVQAIGLRSLGLGLAIKIADGSREAMYCALFEVLAQLDLLPAVAALPPELARFAGGTIRNARGLATGRMRGRFTLHAV